jgi:hypothetical protein
LSRSPRWRKASSTAPSICSPSQAIPRAAPKTEPRPRPATFANALLCPSNT